MIGGMYQGDIGAGVSSPWPLYAPRLGQSFRNPILGGIIPNFSTGSLKHLTNLPVGYGGLPAILKPLPRLPELAEPTTTPPQIMVSDEIDRRDEVLPETTKQGVILRQARDWIEFWRLKDQGIEVLAPTATSRAAAPTIVATTPKTTGNKSMDLGSLITDLGGQYISARYGQPSTGYMPVSGPIQATPALSVPGALGAGALAGEALDYFLSEDGTILGKKKCKKRRRRKRLATVSDIADLAALKSILGNGDAFKTWIATHSR